MFSARIHRYIFLFGVCALAFGMMIGTVPTSVPQFILLGNWLLELDFKRKWEQLKSNKVFWTIAAIYIAHVIGLFYTSDFADGIKDVKTKMPLVFLPVIFLTNATLTKKEFHLVLNCFLLGALINVGWCYIYSFVLHKNEVARSASRFMSHIRLGLYLNVAVATCVYFIFEYKDLMKRLGYVFLFLLYLFSMYALGLASGVANFIILSLLFGVYMVWKLDMKVKVLLIASIICAVIFIGRYVYNIYEDHIVPKNTKYNSLHHLNSEGKLYLHLNVYGQKENGNYVHRNIELHGLRSEWNRRVPEDTFSYTPQHNLTRYEILIRYMSSKELTKDSTGIWKLTDKDINNIRNNQVNYLYPEWSYLHKRIYEIVYEYDEFINSRNINGHSLSMRPYFWKAALHIIKQHPVMGIGTGDVQDEMNRAYKETHSPLDEHWYKRPHNQFITITVALGIFGLIVFLISLFWPVISLRKHFPVLFWPWFYLALSSFLLEDTLESQAGLTFFAFFNAFFIGQAYYERKENLQFED